MSLREILDKTFDTTNIFQVTRTKDDSDHDIKSRIIEYLIRSNIPLHKLVVEVNNGDVAIFGLVDSIEEKARIQMKLMNLGHIRNLNTTLQVCETDNFSDQEIIKNIYKRFSDAENFDFSGVLLRIHNGTLIVGGNVKSKIEKIALYAIIINVPGIKEIYNEIRIR